jgi:carbonic anhydrase/acetyltransferase-like protein (isoleucine patch superfamily)
MELPLVAYRREDFLETPTGEKLSRRSLIRGSANIHLDGKCMVSPGVVIRGDLGRIKIGRNTIVREDAVLRPSYKQTKGQLRYINSVIGDNVYIGQGSII